MSTHTYAPAAIIEMQSLSANIAEEFAPLTSSWENEMSPKVWEIFQLSQSFTIRQQVKLLPKALLSCPPCAYQENSYTIFAGLTKDSETAFLRIDETSNDCNRCFCSPFHPFVLEVRQHIPFPSEQNISTDAAWLNSDVQRDWNRLTSDAERQRFLNDFYKKQPVLMTIARNDGQRCCALPCKCLQTFVFCNCCQDAVHVYSGALPANLQELGRIPGSYIQQEKLLASVIQPCAGGWCFPELQLYAAAPSSNQGGVAPFAKLTGPFCFGGWSEMCFDFKFFVSKDPLLPGDIAVITKKMPQSTAAAGVLLVSSNQVFTITFPEHAQLSVPQKASVLASQMLTDYMLFDGNTRKWSYANGRLNCYFWYCMVLGGLFPCMASIPVCDPAVGAVGNNSANGGPSAETIKKAT